MVEYIEIDHICGQLLIFYGKSSLCHIYFKLMSVKVRTHYIYSAPLKSNVSSQVTKIWPSLFISELIYKSDNTFVSV